MLPVLRRLGRAPGVGGAATLVVLALAVAAVLFVLQPNLRSSSTPGNTSTSWCGQSLLTHGDPISEERAIAAAINLATSTQPVRRGSEDLAPPQDLFLITVDDVRAERTTLEIAHHRLGAPASHSAATRLDGPVWLVTVEGSSFASTHSLSGATPALDQAQHAVIVDARTGDPLRTLFEPLSEAPQLVAPEHAYEAPLECRERAYAAEVYQTGLTVLRGRGTGGDRGNVRGYTVPPTSNVLPLYLSLVEGTLDRSRPEVVTTVRLRLETGHAWREGVSVMWAYAPPGVRTGGTDSYTELLLRLYARNDEEYAHLFLGGDQRYGRMRSVETSERLSALRLLVDPDRAFVGGDSTEPDPPAATPVATPSAPLDPNQQAAIDTARQYAKLYYGAAEPKGPRVSTATLAQGRRTVAALPGDGPFYNQPDWSHEYGPELPTHLVLLDIAYRPTEHLPASAGGVTQLKPAAGVMYALVDGRKGRREVIEHGFRSVEPGRFTLAASVPCVPSVSGIAIPHYVPGEPDTARGITYETPTAPPKVTRQRALESLTHFVDETCPQGPLVSARHELMSGPLYRDKVLDRRSVWIVSVVGRATTMRGGPDQSSDEPHPLEFPLGGRDALRESNLVIDAETGQFLGEYNWR